MARSKKPRDKPNIGDLLNRFAAQEDEFLRREFLAPALRGGTVRVRIAGVSCQLNIDPPDFQGWGIFQPVTHTAAKFVRLATLAERRQYLELFPMIRLILCHRAGVSWYGSAASFGDSRIRIEGLAPVELADEVQLFDWVRTRYDGARFWFEELDMRHDPAASAYLRSALNDRLEPDHIERRGLTAEERASYELSYWELVTPPEEAGEKPRRSHQRGKRDIESEADSVRNRLRESLSHAGAQLVEYLERADSFRVTFNVGGQQYTSSVNKDDLTVQVAGICLSGEDQKFDLSSLVGVLREADGGGDIVRVGDDNHGMNEEIYWHVHPRR